jgi:hypothetical protein
MFKVLDVREFSRISGGSVSQGMYGGSGSVNLKETTITVVIAEDEDKERVRFEFYPKYKNSFLDSTMYYGYTGDFNELIPGDKFIIEDTSTWQRVVRIIEEN